MSKDTWGDNPNDSAAQWGAGTSQPSPQWGHTPDDAQSEFHNTAQDSSFGSPSSDNPAHGLSNEHRGGDGDDAPTTMWAAADPLATPSNQPHDWTVTSAPAKRSKRGPLLAAIGGAVAVAAVFAGWMFYANGGLPGSDNAAEERLTVTAPATATRSPADSDSEKTTPAPPADAQPQAQGRLPEGLDRCDPNYLESVKLGSYNVDRTDNTPYFCDGEWLVTQHSQEMGWVHHWENGWVIFSGNEVSPIDDRYACVPRATADRVGLPKPLYEKVLCNDLTPAPAPAPARTQASAPGFQSPACDGQYILIVESVIHHPGEDKQALINAALAKYPGASYTNPGQCSSLRARFDGGDVYPIYYSYGFDTASLCQQKARLGGNARSLNRNSDFFDPC
ncbi:hypothetical protein ACFPVT_03935 [Corynebacterium choanae]|uniref:Uncharacterized protein n=1 Tax=Corynebacterium choanae TaxID=1862358 RepID=A0A3G6J8E8_9CORY|nr:hypothetical protein [Corynebacterium choanae]AZA14337.1 hypothetical protein CCHOA_09770 [Corynebacterium choanae]